MQIIITGASSGIGYETVKGFLKDPENEVVAISRNSSKLEQLKRECLEANPEAKLNTIAYDLSDIEQLPILVNQICLYVTKVDLLLHNAGYLVNKPFETIAISELEQIYRTNVFAPFRLTQLCLPLLKRSNRAQIITMGSMGGVAGSSKFAGLTAYSSSKGALSILSECLAEELKESAIRVNCLAIGAVDTEMLAKAFPSYVAKIKSAEMAGFIINFAIKQASFFNGKTIEVSTGNP
ncbi:MAG TPA: SDR family oxidoreductase [Bacteroidia bacterium]|nr:SDR family oxidoreductase [Bacteroidia bacterium]